VNPVQTGRSLFPVLIPYRHAPDDAFSRTAKLGATEAMLWVAFRGVMSCYPVRAVQQHAQRLNDFGRPAICPRNALAKSSFGVVWLHTGRFLQNRFGGTMS
jgi:hypothetical protein